ncbi:GNAT family N-acetyltransferase [Nocardioides bigeumensis]|uniref:GNAT family N-acetyltransferase n=1 Tax=Nocardioides bigeumensis TaxID=433657 RepID=UPI0031D93433
MRIRPARLDDALSVSELEHRNLGGEAWPFGFVAQGVGGEVPTAHWFVADADGPLVGHAVVSVAAEIAELQRISVDAEHRRTGLATRLLATIEDLAVELGADRVLLEVREDNDGARAFYAAAGYAVLDRRPRYYADGTAAEVMIKHLSEADRTSTAAPA